MTRHPEYRDSLVNGQANTEASCVCVELGVEEAYQFKSVQIS